jgi:hypothetical protein
MLTPKEGVVNEFRMAGGWKLMLICFERKVLLTGCGWLVCSERKVLLTGG